MTVSSMRCLLAVLALSEAFERVASRDVARFMGVRRPTVHNLLAALREKGLIDMERYGEVRLTGEGRDRARTLERQRDDMALVFARELGLDSDEAVRAALLLMSGLGGESIERICARCGEGR